MSACTTCNCVTCLITHMIIFSSTAEMLSCWMRMRLRSCAVLAPTIGTTLGLQTTTNSTEICSPFFGLCKSVLCNSADYRRRVLIRASALSHWQSVSSFQEFFSESWHYMLHPCQSGTIYSCCATLVARKFSSDIYWEV